MTLDAHNSFAASGGYIATALILFGVVIGLRFAIVWVWLWS